MSIGFSFAVLDASLDELAAGTELYACSSQPTDRSSAISAALTDLIVLSSADFAKSTQGANRRLTVAAKSTTATGTGNITHIAICNGVSLLYWRLVPTRSVTTGGVVNFPSFTIDAVPQAV
jgi:hypothetical protein